MARTKNETNGKNGNGANLGFEQTLWATADKMRGHMDAAEYKHVALRLIFLKYISDAFQELYDDLEARQETDYTDPEDRGQYLGVNVFWVPKEARWSHIQANAKQPTIDKLIDEAMLTIEKENPRLKGVLPMQYARPDLDKQRLGELIDLISTLGLGDSSSRSKDILGRVCEYFLGQFAEKEGKGGGEFYTPQSVVKLLVAMIEPYKGRIYDPYCGSGGMFVQSELMKAHATDKDDIARPRKESILTVATAQKLTYLPTLTTWLTKTVQMSADGNYSHRLLEEDLAIRAGIISELQSLVRQAHEDQRQKLRNLVGLSSSLDPLEEETTTGTDTSFINDFPRHLELTTLKGYFGEIMAAVVAENFNPLNEDWRVFAFPFRSHQMAYHALEKIRQGGSAPTIIGRFGNDMLAFQCDNQGKITHVLFCEAKCTARHDASLIVEAHQKSSDSEKIPVDCSLLIDILQDYAVAGSDEEKWIHALRNLYFSNTSPTHERCDLVSYICGLPPVKPDTVIIPKSAPHSEYTAERRLEAVEIHLHDVNGLIEEVYQAITQPITCALDETELLTLWDKVVLHIPPRNQLLIKENCYLFSFDGEEAVIGIRLLTTFRDVQRQTSILQDAFRSSGNFTPSKSQPRIKIRLKVV